LQEFEPAARELYGNAYRAMTSRFAARHGRGSDPEVVTGVVLEAIEAPRPRARYLVGKQARVFALAAKLPPFLLDPLRQRLFGLPRRREPAQ
jgi:hypothetical protein